MGTLKAGNGLFWKLILTIFLRKIRIERGCSDWNLMLGIRTEGNTQAYARKLSGDL